MRMSDSRGKDKERALRVRCGRTTKGTPVLITVTHLSTTQDRGPGG